MHKGKIYGR
jgi:hypothetical protein